MFKPQFNLPEILMRKRYLRLFKNCEAAKIFIDILFERANLFR